MSRRLFANMTDGAIWKDGKNVEAEVYQESDDGERPVILVYRFSLDDFPDWADLDDVARFGGQSRKDFERDLRDEDMRARYHAFYMIGQYHGFDNLDSQPLELTEKQLEKRLRGPSARQRYQQRGEKAGDRSWRKRAEKLLVRLDRGQLDNETLRRAPKQVQFLVDQMLEARGSGKVAFEARFAGETVKLFAHNADSYEMERVAREYFQDRANAEERSLFVTLVADHVRPWTIAVRPQ